MVKKALELSVVIPVFNEEGSIEQLHKKLISVCKGIGCTFEVIVVNDGSHDGTLKKLNELRPIKIINLRKNFGQTAALDAGIKAATGNLIATLDGDGQNDPADIPRLIKRLQTGGFDCVSGWRKYRRDPFTKRFVSNGAHFLRRFLINDGIHDSGCTLKIYKRECFANIDLYGEMHRFIPALLKIRGFKIGEIAVKHHPRRAGYSKYNWKRMVKGALDILSLWFWGKYMNRPLHIFGYCGLIIILMATMSGCYALYRKITIGADLSSSSLTYLAIVGFFAGLQLIIFGLLMDIVIKTYYSSKKISNYEISTVIERS